MKEPKKIKYKKRAYTKTVKNIEEVKSTDNQKTVNNENQNIYFFIKHKEPISLLLLFLLFIGIGSSGLGKFFTSDETAWYYGWIQQYGHAYLSGDFAKTNVADYPGALHSLLCGSVNLFLDQKDFITYDKVETYLFWWRFPILLFNGISLIGIYYLLKKFFSQIQSFVAVFLIAFSPFLLGMSRIVNSDSLLWSTSLISILAYIIFIRENKNKYMIISGVFMGMALASKYNAVILFIYHPLILIFEFLFDKTKTQTFNKIVYKTFISWLIAFAMFSILLPAVFADVSLYNAKIFRHFITNPGFIIAVAFIIIDTYLLKNKILFFLKEKVDLKKYLIKTIPAFFIGLIITALIIKYLNLAPESWLGVAEQWKVPYDRAMYENLVQFFASQQIAIIAGFIIFAIISLLPKNKNLDFTLPLLMLVFIFVFIIGVTLKHSNGIGHRYIVMLYPFAIITAVWSFSFFKKKHIIFALIILLSIIDTAMLYPKFYISYNNSCYFTGAKTYYWSLGGYDLAQDLNKLSDANNIKVYADRYSFKHFFRGYTENIIDNTKGSKLKEFDYLCLSTAGSSQVPMTPQIEDYYEMPKDSFEYFVGNKYKWWMGIIKVDKNKKETTIPDAYDPEFYLNISNSFTISLWEKHSKKNAGNIIYIGKNYEDGIEVKIKKNNLIVKYGKNEFLESSSLPIEKYNNIIIQHITKNETQVCKIWVNGENIIDKVIENKKTKKRKFFIAKKFKGFSNDVRIYGTELTEDQIKTIYNNGKMIQEYELESNGEIFRPLQHFTHKQAIN